MYVTPDNLPDNAKAWLFPCRKPLADAHQRTLTQTLTQFLTDWCSHGQALQASVHVTPYEVVLFVNTAAAVPSGCALDSWHSALRTVSNALGIDCFYHEQICCKTGAGWHIYTPDEALAAWEGGTLKDNTLIANVQVKNKIDFFSDTRLIPLHNSWLAARKRHK